MSRPTKDDHIITYEQDDNVYEFNMNTQKTVFVDTFDRYIRKGYFENIKDDYRGWF